MFIKTKYFEGQVVPRWATYVDGSPALQLYTPSGELVMTATVCLAEYGDMPAPGHIFLKTWSENEGIYEALYAAGIVGEISRVIPAGFAQALEVPLKEAV